MHDKAIYKWWVKDAAGKVRRPRWHMSEDEIKALYPNARELQKMSAITFEVGDTPEEVAALARKRAHSSSDFEGRKR